MCEPERICTDCGDPCEVVEETFGYSGTHCTNGISGTHHTGVWVSDCCGAETEEPTEIFPGTRDALNNLPQRQ